MPDHVSDRKPKNDMMLRSLLNRARTTWPVRQAAVTRSYSYVAAASSSLPQVALVQGASRGLGLEYVRQLLQRPEQR